MIHCCQGELTLIPASAFPADWIAQFTDAVDNPVLAHGETGNAHALQGQGWKRFQSATAPGYCLIRITFPTPLHHPEHHDVQLTDDMIVSVAHEYDPFEHVLRSVAD